MRDTKIISLILLVMAITSLIFSISHYGLNFLPKSNREFYHDIFSVILIALYLISDYYDKKNKLG